MARAADRTAKKQPRGKPKAKAAPKAAAKPARKAVASGEKPASALAKHAFKPGQSGNPAGRPKGSRNKLGEAFLDALCADFQTHGVKVIETVRKEKPDQYLKTVASILPKELNVKSDPLDGFTDEQLAAFIAATADAGGGEEDGDGDA